MHLKIPSAGTPVPFAAWMRAAVGRYDESRFSDRLSCFLDTPHVSLTGSGTCALFGILRGLARRSSKRNVVLSAYTAPSLVLPIRRAGLTPVLADLSTSTFNADGEDLLDRVDSNTLAVMPVHMFGLAAETATLRSAAGSTDLTIIEDACSAMGTSISGRQAGTLCDIGFLSFNRGKNMSTLAGGAVLTADEDLHASVARELEAFPAPSGRTRLRNKVLSAGLAAAVHPLFYTALFPMVSRYKYTELHTDFELKGYTPFQARLGDLLLRRFSLTAGSRRDNALFLQRALSRETGVTLPRELEDTVPVYNQFPILLDDQTCRDRIHRALLQTGLESTILYPDPIHRLYPEFWDGNTPDPYPRATALSRRLLLVPVHPLVPRRALERAVDTIRAGLKGSPT